MKMKKLSLLLATVAFAIPSVAAAATYMPFGPQTNVALSTVTNGGWSLCFQQTMGAALGNSATVATSNCSGDLLMLAGRETGSNTLLLLAAAPKLDALFDTGTGNSTATHNANGSEWYNADRWSWGFAQAGAAVSKNQCDTNSGALRMCLHTFDWVGGYRIGDNYSFDGNYEKLVFTANSGPAGVPEPAAWAMMIAGFGLVGGAMRRRSTSVRVTYA